MKSKTALRLISFGLVLTLIFALSAAAMDAPPGGMPPGGFGEDGAPPPPPPGGGSFWFYTGDAVTELESGGRPAGWSRRHGFSD